MAEKIVLAELDIDVEGLVKNTSELKKQLDALKKAQAELKKAGDTSSKTYIKNAADIKTLSQAYNTNVKALSENTKAVAELAAREDLLNTVLKQEVTSIKEARAQNKLLNKLRNETNATTEEGRQQIEQLNAALNANNDFIRENADNYLQQKINIGNYKDSIKEAFEELNIFNGGIVGFIARSKEAGGVGKLFSSSLKEMTKGMIGMTKATLSFLLTPIGVFLAAISAAFLLVRNAMNRSEESTNKINKAFSVFSGLLNLVLRALKPLGDFLINGIVKSLEFVEKSVYAVIESFAGILSFLGFDEMADSVRGFNNEMKEATKSAKALADAEAELKKAQRETGKEVKKLQKQQEDLRQVRDDVTKTYKERNKANDELALKLQEQQRLELKTAAIAVKAAKLYIKEKGKQKDSLDRLAAAEEEYSDVLERVNGIESEQLTNRNALQKEAADKAKAIREKAFNDSIKKLDDELKLFIAQQGTRAKTLEEQLVVAKGIAERETEILKTKLKNNKKFQAEYDAEILKINNDLADKKADIIVENAELELNKYIKTNESKLDNDKFFSDESLRIEKERLNSIAKKQGEFAKIQLEQGKINKTEYNAAINEINDENQKGIDEAKRKRDKDKKEAETIDAENQRILDEEKFNTELELQLNRLQIKKEQEIEVAKDKGASVEKIESVYRLKKEQLEAAALEAKRNANATAFGQIADLLGEETALGKAAALAQSAINIQVGITKALASKGFAGIVEGAVIAAKGAQSVAKITGIGTKFEKGGFREVGGKRHSQGGTKFFGEDGTGLEVEKGEGIGVFSRDEFTALRNQNNASLASLGTTNNITQFVSQSNSLSEGQVFAAVSKAFQSMPQQVVAVEDIIYQSQSYVQVKTAADL
jgi:hypothetical protein